MKEIRIIDVRSCPGDSAFLIDDGKTSILYDSGFAFTGYEVAKNIKDVLSGRKLDYIFLTHSHYDHVLGSVYVLNYYPEAKVIASEYTSVIFSKPTAKAFMRDLDSKFALKNGVFKYEDLIDNLKVHITVKDGDVIHAGDMEFLVIGLPGHTRCSIGFYLKDKKLLLSCETLGVFDGKDNVIPSFLIGYQITLNSIDKVKKLDIDNILVPHFGLLDVSCTRFYINLSKQSVIDTANDLMTVLKGGSTKADAFELYKKKFYNSDVEKVYPYDAMELNTNIMINLIEKELLN